MNKEKILKLIDLQIAEFCETVRHWNIDFWRFGTHKALTSLKEKIKHDKQP